MKKSSFIFIICLCSLHLLAQPIRYASDATPIIEQINKAVSIKQYEGNLGPSYTFLLIADTVNLTLLKATVIDSQTHSTRTYYFHNNYLIKVTERFEPPSTVSLIHHFFFNTDYALAINYTDKEQKELLVRQRHLVDAYKFLLYYHQCMAGSQVD